MTGYDVDGVLVERLLTNLTDSWQQVLDHVERHGSDPQKIFGRVVRRVCEIEGVAEDDVAMYVDLISDTFEHAVRHAIKRRREKVA